MCKLCRESETGYALCKECGVVVCLDEDDECSDVISTAIEVNDKIYCKKCFLLIETDKTVKSNRAIDYYILSIS